MCLCSCDCGTDRQVRPSTLINGLSTCCGCRKIAETRLEVQDKCRRLIGARYGRLVVTGSPENQRGDAIVNAACDCGNIVTRSVRELEGDTREFSCGCAKRELLKAIKTTHGASKTRVYASWRSMRRRILDKNARHYQRYGGRGITMCERMATLDGFIETMGPRPAGTSIDRIDVNGGYWCGSCSECSGAGREVNVRWADAITQAGNVSNRKEIECRGEKKTAAEWSRTPGVTVSASSIYHRLGAGHTAEDAIFNPITPNGQRMPRRDPIS